MAPREKHRRSGSRRPRKVEVEDFEWVDAPAAAPAPGTDRRASAAVTGSDRGSSPAARSAEPGGAPSAGGAGPGSPATPPEAPAQDPAHQSAGVDATLGELVPAPAIDTQPGGPSSASRSRRVARARMRARARAATGPGFGDLLAAGSALALLICMFAMAWFGVAGVPDPTYARPAVSTTEDGWNGLPVVRWVIVAVVIVAVGSLALHLSQRRHGVRTDTGRAVTALGALAAILLAWRVLVSLPGDGKVLDQKLGALIGLGCALAVAWGGAEISHAQRANAARGGSLRDTSRGEVEAPEAREVRASEW